MAMLKNDSFELIEKRSDLRIPVRKPITTAHGIGDEYLIDVSKAGCCIKTSGPYKKNDNIVIFIGSTSLIGKIIWVNVDRYGVRFLKCQLVVGKPFHHAV